MKNKTLHDMDYYICNKSSTVAVELNESVLCPGRRAAGGGHREVLGEHRRGARGLRGGVPRAAARLRARAVAGRRAGPRRRAALRAAPAGRAAGGAAQAR